MARTRGAFPFSGSFEIKRTSPLDARLLVPTLAELTLAATWEDEEQKIWLYNNIVVTVAETNSMYMLTNYNPVTAPEAYKVAENWIRVDAGGAKIDLVTNLESEDNTKALAASQGKVLSEKIENLKTSLASVYNYKGSVASFEALPTENVAVGDTYNVVAANGNIPAGTNYSWNGTEWDALGGTVDLSGYYTKTEVDALVLEVRQEASGAVDALAVDVVKNTQALEVLNGVEGTEGSLLNALKKATDYTDAQLTAYVLKEEGKQLISDEKLALIDTLDTRVGALETATENLAVLSQTVADHTNIITRLNGTVETEGSVKYIINQEITNALTWQDIIE